MTLAATSPISPCLWFDHELEEAATFYTSVFPNSAIGPMARYPDSGKVMAGEFTLDGITFRAINGGPDHAGFTETISFSVTVLSKVAAVRSTVFIGFLPGVRGPAVGLVLLNRGYPPRYSVTQPTGRPGSICGIPPGVSTVALVRCPRPYRAPPPQRRV